MAPFPVELFDEGPGYLGNLRSNVLYILKQQRIPDYI